MSARRDRFEEITRAYFSDAAALHHELARHCAQPIADAAELIAQVLAAGGKLLLCGNGGSAADCQHMAAEFCNGLYRDSTRPPLAAVALTTDTSFLTACANDRTFEEVFARQVQALGRAGDVLVGISTSGGSRNVVRAFEAAQGLAMKTVALTGEGGVLGEMADVAIRVPHRDTQHIQEAHLAIEHLLCDLIERILHPRSP